jgi:hypothetical protein
MWVLLRPPLRAAANRNEFVVAGASIRYEDMLIISNLKQLRRVLEGHPVSVDEFMRT